MLGSSLPTGERNPAHNPSLWSPYIDAAQVEPLLEAQQHRAVTHQPVGTAGQRVKMLGSLRQAVPLPMGLCSCPPSPGGGACNSNDLGG